MRALAPLDVGRGDVESVFMPSGVTCEVSLLAQLGRALRRVPAPRNDAVERFSHALRADS